MKKNGLKGWIINHPLKFWFISSFLLFILPLGSSPLFDWDEINFAENAREMVFSKNYLAVQLNFEPFFEKPPLFIWLQALSFQIFQVFSNHAWVSVELAARFPNAFIGSLTLLSLYLIGKKVQNAQFGHWWAFTYLIALAPHIYASSGIIDPSFNLFIFLSIFFTWISLQENPWKNTLWATFFLGLAMLTKGPVALLIWGLLSIAYTIFRLKSIPNISVLVIRGLFISLCSASLFFSWYYALSLEYGWTILDQFMDYQIRLLTQSEAGHGQPFYYHFVVLSLVVFPISTLSFPEFFRFRKIYQLPTFPKFDFEALMRLLFWLVLILFSLVKTKIIHYSSMCWIPMTFIGAQLFYQYQNEGFRFSKFTLVFTGIVGLILSVGLLAVVYIGRNPFDFLPFIQDAFVRGNLQAPVYWSLPYYLIGLSMLLMVVYFILIKWNHGIRYILSFSLGYIGLTTLIALFLLPQIARYTQGALIDFCRAKVSQNVYVETIGFKSYAPYFYFQKQRKGPTAEELLEGGEVDLPVFFIMKNTAEEAYRYHPAIELLKEENGYLFFRKKTKP